MRHRRPAGPLQNIFAGSVRRERPVTGSFVFELGWDPDPSQFDPLHAPGSFFLSQPTLF